MAVTVHPCRLLNLTRDESASDLKLSDFDEVNIATAILCASPRKLEFLLDEGLRLETGHSLACNMR